MGVWGGGRQKVVRVLIQWYTLVFEDLTSHFDFWKKIFLPWFSHIPYEKNNSNFFRKLQWWMSQYNLTKGWIQIIYMKNITMAKTQWEQIEIQETLFKGKRKPQNHFSTMRVVRQRYRLPREIMKSPSMQMFQVPLLMAVSNLLSLTLLWAETRTRQPAEVPPHLSQSVILWLLRTKIQTDQLC